MNKNDTKLKVDALEWRVELPVASKAALRVRFSSFLSLSLSLSRACVSSRSFFSVLSHCFQESISPNCDSSLKQMKESKGDAVSAKSAADAQASAVLTLRGSRGSDSNATTTNVRLSEEDCVKLRDSMDEAAKRVKEVMEKYGGEEGEK